MARVDCPTIIVGPLFISGKELNSFCSEASSGGRGRGREGKEIILVLHLFLSLSPSLPLSNNIIMTHGALQVLDSRK